MKPTLRGRLREWRYWFIHRPIDRGLWRLARALPDSFRRRVWYSVTADATTSKELGHREVPSVTVNEVMNTFPTSGNRP